MRTLFMFYAICVALGASCAHVRTQARPSCGYYAVLNQQQLCLSSVITDPGNYQAWVGEPLLSAICSEDVGFAACMSSYAEGCSDKAEILDLSNITMAHCNGTRLQTWLAHSLAETSSLVEPACLSSLGIGIFSLDNNFYRRCVMEASEAEASRHTPGVNFNPSVKFGHQVMTSWQADLYACARSQIEQAFSGGALPPACQTTTARLVYNKLVTEMNVFPVTKDSFIPAPQSQIVTEMTVFPVTMDSLIPAQQPQISLGHPSRRGQLLYAWLRGVGAEN